MSDFHMSGLIESLEIRKIRTSKQALRDELGPLDELVSSISEKGMLQPIVVRPIRDEFEVVAGHRRLEACRLLHWRTLPCHIVELDDREAFEVSLIENMQRRTLDLFEEARAFKRYVEDYGYGAVSQLARSIGKSPSYVSRKISMLKLPREVQEELLRMRKTSHIAQEIATLGEEDAKWVTKVVVEDRIQREELRQVVKQIKVHHNSDNRVSRVPRSSSAEMQEKNVRALERALNKSMASMKICMFRISDAIGSVEDHVVVRDALVNAKAQLNEQIDNMFRVKKRILSWQTICNDSRRWRGDGRP